MNKILRMLCLSLFLSVIPTMKAQDTSKMRDSLSVISNKLAAHPDSIELRLEKAAVNMQLEQWNYAMDEYNYVLDRYPKNITALYFRAFVNEKQHRYNFARLDYQNLLCLVPGNFEATLGLALLNQKDQHYTEANDQINSLIQQYPDSAIAYAARAGMEEEREMYVPAEYDFTEAIKRDCKNTDYILARADIRIKLNERKKAKEDLDRLVLMGVPKASLMELYNKCK